MFSDQDGARLEAQAVVGGLESLPGVAQVGLRGDYMHAITVTGAHDPASLQRSLGPYGAGAVIKPEALSSLSPGVRFR